MNNKSKLKDFSRFIFVPTMNAREILFFQTPNNSFNHDAEPFSCNCSGENKLP